MPVVRLAVVYLLEELTLLAVACRQQNLRSNLGPHTTSTPTLALAPVRAVALALEQKAGTEQVGVKILGPPPILSVC